MEKTTSIDESVGDSSSLSHRRQQTLFYLAFKNLSNSQKDWLSRQRIEYVDNNYKPSQKLSEEQIEALNGIDPDWYKTVGMTYLYCTVRSLRKCNSNKCNSLNNFHCNLQQLCCTSIYNFCVKTESCVTKSYAHNVWTNARI